MSRLVICYKRYESLFEENDTESNEWQYYLGTLEQFELENPTVKIIFCFNGDED